MRRIAIAVVMVLVVCVLFWAGWHNLRARRMAMQKAQQAQVTVTKDADESPDAPHLRGQASPAFTLMDTTGKKVSLADFKGHPVVVNFWATWCGPCQEEMPWLEEFHNKYKAQGVQILGISDEPDQPKEEILKTATKLGVTYPLLLPDGAVGKAYGVGAYWPTTFYVDKNGIVAVQNVGAPSKDEMEANIRKIAGL